jgi:serine/threonine protein phosphatase PrpC
MIGLTPPMITVKDTQRATVQVCFDGSVRKTFHGPNARERFTNEVRILRHLETEGCSFVPRVLSADAESLVLVTTNCGTRVDQLDPKRCRELFAELVEYGVRHDDPETRNVTYRLQDGRFCLIDFEFAELLEKPALPVAPLPVTSPVNLKLDWSACSEKGPIRETNEDSWLGLSLDGSEVWRLSRFGSADTKNCDLIFAVGDGMGGARSGEFASRIAVEKITRRIPPLLSLRSKGRDISHGSAFTLLYAEINKALHYLGESYEECRDMGTTLSICWFSGSFLHFAHVGDTRIHHLPAEGGIRQLTHDDTHVGWLLRTGRISELAARMHPARNRLQKALGSGNQFVEPQIGAIPCQSGDRFLICSDGLSDAVANERIPAILSECPKGTSPAEHLVREAVAISGRDNTTAVIMSVP